MKPLEKASYDPKDPRHNKTMLAVKASLDENLTEAEVWMNDVYQVEIRRGLDFMGEVMDNQTIAHISIKRLDKRAIMDWRHMQWIKNQLVGEENEGVELFPAESRLVDGANQFHMWVFENPEIRFPFGFQYRLVTEKSMMGETQRKWPVSRRPQDIEENEQAMQRIIDEAKKSL